MTRRASWCGLGAEHEALIELVLCPVTEAKTDQGAHVAHVLVLEGGVESELEAPEQQGRDHAHAGIEDEGLHVVQGAGGAETEDEDLVEDVFHNQAGAGANEHRELDLEGAVPDADRELLGPEIRRSRDQSNDCVDDREPHRLTLAILRVVSISTAGEC